MRYTVMGFLQKGACELGLSMGDLAILRWFTDFKNSGKMITKHLKAINIIGYLTRLSLTNFLS